MNLSSAEHFFSNLSFVSLLFTVLFYWIRVIFPNMTTFGNLGMVISNFCITSLLITRWINSNHIPLSNLYESLIFLCWSITLIHLIIELTNKTNFLGFLTAPTALLVNAYATLSLPYDMQKATPLIPALKSNWLMMHVTIMIVSYAALILGCLLSITFLFLTLTKQVNLERNVLKYSNLNDLLAENTELDSLSSLSTLFHTLDNLSYRILGFGFISLTLGIISGAVWANEAWGSYWSWDPKETWALITWLVFAVYLHTRLIKGWKGRKPALVASVGFVVVWICYLGVNLLGKGLHSYGWLS